MEGEEAESAFLTSLSEASLPCEATRHRSATFGDFSLRWGSWEFPPQNETSATLQKKSEGHFLRIKIKLGGAAGTQYFLPVFKFLRKM